MKMKLLIALSCLVVTAVHAQKTPKGIDEFERELFTKRVDILTWVKHLVKNEYYWVSGTKIEEQMQLFGEAKRVLSLYGKTFDDAFLDLSSFCPGTDHSDFEQIQEGLALNQELLLVFHLSGDWVLQLNISNYVNSMILSQWKNEDWSVWEDDPLQQQLNLLDLIISE